MSSIYGWYYTIDPSRLWQYQYPYNSPFGRVYVIPSEYIPDDYVYLWPVRSGVMGDFSVSSLNFGQLQPTYFEHPYRESGNRRCYIISGRTLNVNGNPLGGCTVDAFTTSDDVKQGTAVSDENGNYVISTESSASHYVVAYKDGPPDVFGTTVDTITPV